MKHWLNYGHLKLETFYILIVCIGKFYDCYRESKNVKFGFKAYYGWDKWKIEFDEQKCKV